MSKMSDEDLEFIQEAYEDIHRMLKTGGKVEVAAVARYLLDVPRLLAHCRAGGVEAEPPVANGALSGALARVVHGDQVVLLHACEGRASIGTVLVVGDDAILVSDRWYDRRTGVLVQSEYTPRILPEYTPRILSVLGP